MRMCMCMCMCMCMWHVHVHVHVCACTIRAVPLYCVQPEPLYTWLAVVDVGGRLPTARSDWHARIPYPHLV